jgi:hypothetical protein
MKIIFGGFKFMNYDMLIPSIPFIGGYIATYLMYNRGIIRRAFHVNLWNIVLLSSFLVSGGAGFLILVLSDIGINTSIIPQLNYWHVEFGITMALVTLFHLHAYWKSTKTMIISARRRSEA